MNALVHNNTIGVPSFSFIQKGKNPFADCVLYPLLMDAFNLYSLSSGAVYFFDRLISQRHKSSSYKFGYNFFGANFLHININMAENKMIFVSLV